MAARVKITQIDELPSGGEEKTLCTAIYIHPSISFVLTVWRREDIEGAMPSSHSRQRQEWKQEVENIIFNFHRKFHLLLHPPPSPTPTLLLYENFFLSFALSLVARMRRWMNG